MPNFRSITPEAWEHARQALVFYFSRRHGFAQAEDLAQETLMAIMSREDFEFEKQEDFLRVCYGFASRIALKGHRTESKYANDLRTSPPASRQGNELNKSELAILLQEVCRIGQTQLRDQEWKLIQAAATSEDRTNLSTESGDANRVRVKLHRARKKLALLTGWHK
jgi:DNA-directed RNA polymerase specialized sigma24 family protein